MQAALAPRGDSRTSLTHFVGSGLDDDRPKGRRSARPRIVSLKALEKLRPARDEIIVATGVNCRDSSTRYRQAHPLEPTAPTARASIMRPAPSCAVPQPSGRAAPAQARSSHCIRIQ